jgi:hypothetical protein
MQSGVGGALSQVVEEPRINVPPTRASEAVLPVTAQSTTPGVTLRYTLDGSRPTEASPAMPTAGATPAATANSAITAAAYLEALSGARLRLKK